MFPRQTKFPRQGLRALTKLLLTLAFVFAVQHTAAAAGTFVSAPNRVDMVYDSARDTLYITSGPSVLRYQLSTNSFLAPFNLGGNLAGLDLSPDGNTLVVADRTRDALNVWVHVIDLRTGASSKAVTPRDSGEGGTFTVAYGADNQLLVTSTYEGSGWVPLRRLNPATGAWTKLNNLLAADGGTLSQDAMLAASGDRSVIGFAEANISDGRWGSYNVTNGTLVHRTWYENGTSWFNFEIGVNKNGTQYAIPTYGGTFVYNASFVKVGTLGAYAGAEPIGVVYHPVEDIAYFPWTTTTQVRAFNMNTLAQVAAYDFQDTFTWNGNSAFKQGRMKMSRDGSLLIATVTGGVRFIRLYAPLAAADQSVTTVENTPAAVTLAGSVGNNGALSYRVAAQPAHGTLSGTGANLTYTPETNYEGPDSFTFKSVYGPAESAAATVSITVTHGNSAPTADDQAVSVNEDGSAAVTLTGTDPDGSAVSFTVVTQPAYGTLSGTAPNLVYTPAANFYGSDSFNFQTSDGAASTVGHVYITVNGVNDPPAVTGQSLATDEDTALPVTLAGTDIDSSPLNFMVFAPPAHGSLSGTMPNLVYTPAPNYNGPDSFGFKASDGSADSNDAYVNINVRSVNDAPVANAQSLAMNEDSPASVTLSGSDADGDAISFAVVNAPAHGTLSGAAPNLVYTPAPNYNGPDSFTFLTSDGTAPSSAATVTLNVAAVNDAPTANSQSVTTSEDNAGSVVLTGSDVDGDAIAYLIVSAPAHGNLSGTMPNFTYTPAPNYNGPDSFTFKTSDGRLDSGVATVSINVTPVNDAPLGNPQSVSTDEDTPVSITLSGSDPDGDALSYVIVDNPSRGTLSGTAPNLVYTPAANYNGGDDFSFRVSDGTVSSALWYVSIRVAPVNDAPVSRSQSLLTSEDSAFSFAVYNYDADYDPLTFTVVSQPTHGTLTGTGGSFTYTPAANYNGADSFTYKLNDGTADSAVATISITITAVNDVPVPNAQSVTVNEDSSTPITLTAADADGDTVWYMLDSVPQHGTLSGVVPNLVYTPVANYNGPDSFTFEVSDGKSNSTAVTVTVNVNGVNDAPVANPQSVSTNEDAARQILLSGSDVDGDAISYTVVGTPTHGTLSGTAPNLVYTPAANYNGSDAFTFRVSDGKVSSALATVSLAVSAVNDAPTANSQTLATNEDTAKSVTLTGSDVDGDALSYSLVGMPAHGSLSGTLPNLVYTPAADYNGPDSFTFVAGDGKVQSATATITINVAAVNDAPVAVADTASVVKNSAAVSIAVLSNDRDVDGDVLTITSVTQPSNGTVSIASGGKSVTYKPRLNYRGNDVFNYTVNDGHGRTATASVTVTVK